MTIEFNCPNCGAVIAFDSKHSGKRAKCLTCGQAFVIPAESFATPEKIEPESEQGPIPGFYRAAFLDTVKVFFDRENVTTLAFVVAVVCFKFFLARTCLRQLSIVIVWGWLFGFYLNLIYETALGDDGLPEVYLGTSATLLWHVFQPFIVFFCTLFVVELPLIVLLWLTGHPLSSLNDIAPGQGILWFVRQLFLICGLFLFPAAILVTAVRKDIALLRPDHLLPFAFRSFGPYVTASLLLTATCCVQFYAKQYTGASMGVTAAYLGMNLLAQVLAIFAMRAIGLYYRHYSCNFSR